MPVNSLPKGLSTLLAAYMLSVAPYGAAETTHDSLNDADSNPRCLSISRIKDIDIIDDQTLIFKMNGRKMYLNELPHRCPGLSRNETIMYRTSTSQLCDLDVITLLNSMGRGYMPGASCGLGRYSLISDLQLKALKEAKDR